MYCVKAILAANRTFLSASTQIDKAQVLGNVCCSGSESHKVDNIKFDTEQNHVRGDFPLTEGSQEHCPDSVGNHHTFKILQSGLKSQLTGGPELQTKDSSASSSSERQNIVIVDDIPEPTKYVKSESIHKRGKPFCTRH